MFSLTSVLVAAVLATTTQAAPNPYLRKNANGWSAKGDPYAYDQVLGQSIKFFEVQRSGKLSKSPGGYRIDWKKDQLLFDGYDTEYGAGSLAGGHYEAGSAHPYRYQNCFATQLRRACIGEVSCT